MNSIVVNHRDFSLYFWYPRTSPWREPKHTATLIFFFLRSFLPCLSTGQQRSVRQVISTVMKKGKWEPSLSISSTSLTFCYFARHGEDQTLGGWKGKNHFMTNAAARDLAIIENSKCRQRKTTSRSNTLKYILVVTIFVLTVFFFFVIYLTGFTFYILHRPNGRVQCLVSIL